MAASETLQHGKQRPARARGWPQETVAGGGCANGRRGRMIYKGTCRHLRQPPALAATNSGSLGIVTLDQRPRRSPPPPHPDPPITAAAPTTVHDDGGSATKSLTAAAASRSAHRRRHTNIRPRRRWIGDQVARRRRRTRILPTSCAPPIAASAPPPSHGQAPHCCAFASSWPVPPQTRAAPSSCPVQHRRGTPRITTNQRRHSTRQGPAATIMAGFRLRRRRSGGGGEGKWRRVRVSGKT
ncbi:hypothetical protein BDA96_10G119300 [Sorghum bicolor]|uniref:Uncharacterized protein n=1 Tax=Sorghum bicolor TaxID=4558 RepID=A0A921Q3Q4_SORBI|nr:hypothetical protein BDA96_10G119300 [Sorghum bicolor]